jgi:hypothetical protein
MLVSIKHIQKEKIICLLWDSNQCSLFPKSLAIKHRAWLPPGAANNHPFATSIHGSKASKPHPSEN